MTAKTHLFLKPTIDGAVIRDPRTMAKLPAAGGRVPNNTFWQRRLMAKEVEKATPPKAPKAQAKAKPTKGDKQ